MATDNPQDLLAEVRARLGRHERVRLPLPHEGRVYVDRDLPFLAVYRTPPERPDAGTSELVTGQAAYLLASGDPSSEHLHAAIVDLLTDQLGGVFGGFLLVEVWSGPRPADDASGLPPLAFRIVAEPAPSLDHAVEELRDALEAIDLERGRPTVSVERVATVAPPGLAPLPRPSTRRPGVAVIGIEVAAVHQDPRTGEPYPIVLAALRRGLTGALARAFHTFTDENTSLHPVHWRALGRRVPGAVVAEVDRELAAISESFDFTLLVTPINVRAAWHAFRAGRHERVPDFVYRPLPIDPVLTKRRLYAVPLERIEDPTLAALFSEKVDELDRMLTMIQDIGTPRFLWGGLQLFGPVDDDLLALARRLLRVVPAEERSLREEVDPTAFAAFATAEIAAYREQWPELVAEVKVRPDVSGLMHSRGRILIGADSTFATHRVDALVQHEVGTHLVCYHNGRAQPFQQLYAGLAGYRELQEGLAVLSEWLVGGLDRPRLRVLAARVVAARAVTDGMPFVETFRELEAHHGFAPEIAFRIAMRVYRGGGLVRDAVYLRSLVGLLAHLGAGHPIEPLFVGRIALHHVPVMRELLWREVLREPPLRPRFLDRPEAAERLQRLRREAFTPVDLVFERRQPDATALAAP